LRTAGGVDVYDANAGTYLHTVHGLGQTPYMALFGASGTDPVGKMMLVAALVLQILGFLWIRKIIRIEI
jgi:Flp pilus assembly protein TadB